MGDKRAPRGRSDPPTPARFDWPDVDRGRPGDTHTDGAIPAYPDFIGPGKAVTRGAELPDWIKDFDKPWTHAEIYPQASAIYDGALRLLCEKHLDYGKRNISASPGGPLSGLRVRIHDKTARINYLLDNDVEPTNESLRDSFLDLLNYAAIGLLVLDGTWPE